MQPNADTEHKSRNMDAKSVTNDATRTTAVTTEHTLTQINVNLGKTFKLYDLPKI